MPLSNASRLADFGTGIGTAGAIIQVDNANQRLGVGTTAPTATLGVAGIVSATAFYGDGSNLDGVASAGLGTALSEVEFDPLTVIYQTSDTLSVGATITVDPPDATTKVAYTQYAEILLQDDADLIVADGDDFIPDILGLSTEGFSFSNTNGNGVFDTVYTDNIENAAGRGAPNFPLGITVTGISTLSGNVSIGGTLTYEDVTNVDSIGVVTARSGVDINAGGLDITAGGVNVGGISTFGGNVKIGSGTPGGKLHIGPIGSGDIVAELTSGSPTFTYRNGSGAWFHAGKHPSQDAFIISDGANTTANERLRIGSSGQIGLSGANYGTSGQVITSQGGSAAPQWADAGGGAWEYVSTHTISGSESYVDFNNWSTASYSQYKLVFDNITANVTFGMRFQNYYDTTDGATGTLYTSSGYANGESFVNVTGSAGSGGPNSNASCTEGWFANLNLGNQWFGENNFIMKTPNWNYMCSYGHTFSETRFSENAFSVSSASASNYLTGVRILFYNSSNNPGYTPASGKLLLYALKRS